MLNRLKQPENNHKTPELGTTKAKPTQNNTTAATGTNQHGTIPTNGNN